MFGPFLLLTFFSAVVLKRNHCTSLSVVSLFSGLRIEKSKSLKRKLGLILLAGTRRGVKSFKKFLVIFRRRRLGYIKLISPYTRSIVGIEFPKLKVEIDFIEVF